MSRSTVRILFQTSAVDFHGGGRQLLAPIIHSVSVNQFCQRKTGPPGTSASELVPVVEYTQKYLFNTRCPHGIFQLCPLCLVMRKWFIRSFLCWFCHTLLCRNMIAARLLKTQRLLKTLFLNFNYTVFLSALTNLGLCSISLPN